MNDQRELRSILIVGGGTAGWMTAAALATLFPAIKIELVESDAIASVGVGEATIPPIRLFNQMLGLSDADLLREAEATYKLGIEFVGWTRADQKYIHPFGAFGQPLGAVDFHQLWLRASSKGAAGTIDHYNLAACAS